MIELLVKQRIKGTNKTSSVNFQYLVLLFLVVSPSMIPGAHAFSPLMNTRTAVKLGRKSHWRGGNLGLDVYRPREKCCGLVLYSTEQNDTRTEEGSNTTTKNEGEVKSNALKIEEIEQTQEQLPTENSDKLTQIKEWINSQRLAPFPLPIEVQDSTVLYYDIFLLLNLSVSISFWVVHRLSFFNITEAFSEGCLLCILWILAGLYNGAFLYSATDGHYDMTKEEDFDKGGPKAAGLLGLWTFVGTINLRLAIALTTAITEHRPVGINNGEELIPLELCFGLVLMSMWRMLHSTYSRV